MSVTVILLIGDEHPYEPSDPEECEAILADGELCRAWCADRFCDDHATEHAT